MRYLRKGSFRPLTRAQPKTGLPHRSLRRSRPSLLVRGIAPHALGSPRIESDHAVGLDFRSPIGRSRRPSMTLAAQPRRAIE